MPDCQVGKPAISNSKRDKAAEEVKGSKKQKLMAVQKEEEKNHVLVPDQSYLVNSLSEIDSDKMYYLVYVREKTEKEIEEAENVSSNF